jgi:tocopherol cyclase
MKNLRYPVAFQGSLKKNNYYEGWYNKIVDRSEQVSYAFIPTIAINQMSNNSQAFIQILNGQTGKMHYIRYNLDQFENLSNTEFAIKIKDNYFSSKGFIIDFHQDDMKIKGKIQYINPVLWPRSFLQPNIMGILNYFPFLETYHGIVSMNHAISGSLDINGKKINFNEGKGYLEKDWGTSFPEGYIWAQTNHFREPDLSIVLSIALVPLFGIKIKGFFCVIWHKGDFYTFTTYTNAKVRFLNVSSNLIKILIEDRKYMVNLTIDKSNLKFTKLKAPKSGDMSFDIIETLNSRIKVILYDKRKHKVILDDTGTNSGLDLYNITLLK